MQGQAELEATKRKEKGNGKCQGGGKKLKSTQLGSFFPTNVPSNNMSKFQNKIVEENNLLRNEFINYGTHPDAVVMCPDFRALIDHLKNNGQHLKGFYQHMG